MSEWWDSLSFELHIFYTIAILATGVMVLRLLMTLIGFDSDSIDFDLGDVDHGTGIGLFSIQTLSAFFVGFGWGGVIAIKEGLSVPTATGVALAVGGATMAGMYFMITFMLRLQSKGNMDYQNAVGVEGVVYVTLPGSGTSGGGQVELKFQDRLITANAISLAEGPLKPGTRVVVVAAAANNTLTVEPLQT